MQVVQQWLAHRMNQWVVFLLVGGLLVRAAIALWLYPGFDEAYYYAYAINLDWSYFDHPILVALMTGLGPWLTGEVSQFTIRVGTLILYTGALIFLYLTSAQLFSARTATWTLAIATAIPIFQVAFGALTVPDVPLMFFWSAALYVAAVEFFAVPESYHPTYRLAIISVLVGLACLGKYHGFILGAGLVGFCLTSPRYRVALISPWMGVGVVLFGLTLSPMLLWNAHYDWVSFRFQSNRAVPQAEYKLGSVLLTALVGIAYLFPTFGFPLWWTSLKATWDQFFGRVTYRSAIAPDLRQKQRFILWMSLPLIVGFTLMGGYQQILPTWPMPGFWSATLLLGYEVTLWHKRSPRWVQGWLVGSGAVVASLLLIALLHVSIGIVQKPSKYALFGGFWPIENDPSTQLFDIKQLRRGFAESPRLSAALADASFVFTNHYFLGGQIAMALVPLDQTPITCFCEDLRGFAFWSKPDEWLGQDALYVTSKYFQEDDAIAQYRPYFRSIELIGEVPIRRGDAVAQTFYVYQAKTLLKPYPRPYGLAMSS